MRPIVITGPTTVGKSDVSIEVARRLNGEIINSDWMYVYGFLKIGSGLSDCLRTSDISRHLYGICSATESLSVQQYLKKVKDLIPQILARGKLPIIEGCSSLYNPTLIKTNSQFLPIAIYAPQEIDLRQRVEIRLARMFTEGLLTECLELYRQGLKGIHPIQISAVYQPLMKYLDKEITLAAAKEEIVTRWMSFANWQEKRFRQISELIWIEHDSTRLSKTVDQIVELAR